MSRTINITKVGDSTKIQIIKDGITTIESISSSRTLKVYPGGLKIVANKEEPVLNNFKIPFAEVQDKLGARDENELLDKYREQGYFNKGGGVGNGRFPGPVRSTINIGGVVIGDVFNDAYAFVKKLIDKYIAPAFTSFSINATKTNPVVGESITVSTATFTYGYDSAGDFPKDVRINGVGFNVSVAGGTTSKTVAAHTVVKNNAAFESWTLTGKDANGSTIPSRSFSVTWHDQFLFGASDTVLKASNFQTLLNGFSKSKLNSRATTKTANASNKDANNYTYLAYKASYGDLTNVILNGTTPILGAFTKVGTFNWVNAHGVTIPMVVYRSNAKGAFGVGNTIQTL